MAGLFGLSKPVQHLEYGQLSETLALLSEFSASAGGGAANVAKIAAMLGVSVGFTGALGSRPEKAGETAEPGPDRFARLFEEELAALGVELWLARSPRPTGVFLMLKNAEGETRIAVAPSAALDLSGEDIPEDCLRGARAVVLGRSAIVGSPLANLLSRREVNATVSLCHTGTRDLAAHTREADILIAAAGKPGLVTAAMVKEGAAVIDVGMNRVADPGAKKGYRLRGDVDYGPVAEKAGWITPVPGGVGPMTIAMLLQNLVRAAEIAAGVPGGQEEGLRR